LDWTEQQTLTTNYKTNKLLLDPNEGFGRNQAKQPLKSKEERLEEDGETFSDDDGEQQACHTTQAVTLLGAAAPGSTSGSTNKQAAVAGASKQHPATAAHKMAVPSKLMPMFVFCCLQSCGRPPTRNAPQARPRRRAPPPTNARSWSGS
jgi:hypothetical protein